MGQTSPCALCEEQRLNRQDKESELRLSLETRVAEDVTVICCKGRIAYGAEAAALSGEFAELAPQTRRVVIDLCGVEMIDAAGLGALISVALTAQANRRHRRIPTIAAARASTCLQILIWRWLKFFQYSTTTASKSQWHRSTTR